MAVRITLWGKGMKNKRTKVVSSVPKGYGKVVVVPYNWGHLTKNGKTVGVYQLGVKKLKKVM